MTTEEAKKIIARWDEKSAASILEMYKRDELLSPWAVRRLMADLKAENARLTKENLKLREICELVPERYESDVNKLRSENDKMREILSALPHCDDDDFDGRECPLYDENEPNRCKMDRLLLELRIDER